MFAFSFCSFVRSLTFFGSWILHLRGQPPWLQFSHASPDLLGRFLLLRDSLLLFPPSICKHVGDDIGLPHNPGESLLCLYLYPIFEVPFSDVVTGSRDYDVGTFGCLYDATEVGIN